MNSSQLGVSIVNTSGDRRGRKLFSSVRPTLTSDKDAKRGGVVGHTLRRIFNMLISLLFEIYKT